MTKIESTTEINKPAGEVYAFLEDMNNYQQLMPDNIYNWSSTRDEASFTIQNMAKLALKISERVEKKMVAAIPTEKPPFDIALRWELETVSDTQTNVRYVIEADLNMMMKMLASGPLQKLADHQTQQLKETLSK